MIEWVACEARTGRQIAFLRELQPTQALKRTIGRSESAQFTLPLAAMPLEWRRATKRGATFHVGLVDDQPVYGALALTRSPVWGPGADAAVMPVGGATVESYFERRFIGDAAYVNQDQCTMLANIVRDWVANGPTPGIAIGTRVTPSSTIRTYKRADSDDKTVLSALTDIAGSDGGPEWTVEWELVDGPVPVFRPVFVVADQLGQAPRAGQQPPTFDLPGCVTKASVVESYETGRGANRVTATGPKNGDDRTQVTVDDLRDTDMPLYELRGAVSTAKDDADINGTLAAHARAALAIAAPGASALTLSASVDDPRTPRMRLGGTTPGAWQLGDTLGYDIRTPDGGPPGSYSGQARCIGWEWDTTSTPPMITPIIAVPELQL